MQEVDFSWARSSFRDGSQNNARIHKYQEPPCLCIPSRVNRLRKLIKLSSSKRLICLTSTKRYQNIVAKSSSKANGAADARPSCILPGERGGFFAFPIKAHVFSFLLGQIVQSAPSFLCDGRNAASSATRRCIRSAEFFARFRS